MTLKDLLNLCIDKEISFAEAKIELEKLHLSFDERESYENMIYKLIGEDKKSLQLKQLPIIPSFFHDEILSFVINEINAEKYSPDIAQELYDIYGIDHKLIYYFVNEAISIVKLHSLTTEEFKYIGKKYKEVLESINEEDVNLQTVNAEQVSEIIFH